MEYSKKRRYLSCIKYISLLCIYKSIAIKLFKRQTVIILFENIKSSDGRVGGGGGNRKLGKSFEVKTANIIAYHNNIDT